MKSNTSKQQSKKQTAKKPTKQTVKKASAKRTQPRYENDVERWLKQEEERKRLNAGAGQNKFEDDTYLHITDDVAFWFTDRWRTKFFIVQTEETCEHDFQEMSMPYDYNADAFMAVYEQWVDTLGEYYEHMQGISFEAKEFAAHEILHYIRDKANELVRSGRAIEPRKRGEAGVAQGTGTTATTGNGDKQLN